MVDRNYAVIDRRNAAIKRGERIHPDEDPVYALEERAYMGGRMKAFTERHFAPIWKALMDAEVPWHAFGEALFYERIIAGDRSELANPRGLSPENAKDLYDSLRAELGGERRRVLDEQVQKFRTVVKGAAEEAYKAGLYTPELYKQMQANPAYASYQVIEHLEDGVTSRVYKQIGTLKDITNPADATILKTLVTLRAIEHQKVKLSVFKFLEQHDRASIKDAKMAWSGNGQRPIESKDPREKLITYFVQGKLRGKYVDPYIADSLNNESVGQNFAIVSLLRAMNTRVFRPLFTTFNPGFQGFNVFRDFFRFWKNMPGMSVARALKRYYEAAPLARVRAFGLPKNATPAQRQAYQDMLDAEQAGILNVTLNDIILGRQVEDTQIEDILSRTGVPGFRVLPRNPALKPLWALLEFIKETGDFIETLPKAAAVYEFNGAGAIADIPADKRSFIRRKVGSPDYFAGGTWKPVTNELFLFSNAITQAWRSDIEVASDPKTRAGFWWKTAAFNLLPKVLMWGALAGAFGEAVRRMMQRTTEYDRTNYIVVPLGEDGENTVYLRLPQDDSGRLLGGIFWKALQAMRGEDVAETFAQVLDYSAGQLPSLTPTIGLAKDVVAFAGGQNPRDDFRGRDVFTRDEHAARDWRTVKKFLGYEFQTLGGGIVWKFYPGEERPRTVTEGQRILELPVVSNIAGRFVRVTNYGAVESLRNARADVEKTEARRRLTERAAVRRILSDFEGKEPKAGTVAVAAAQLAVNLYPNDPQEAARRRPELRQMLQRGLLRGESNPVIDALLSATSNQQKAAILRRALEDGLIQAPAAAGR